MVDSSHSKSRFRHNGSLGAVTMFCALSLVALTATAAPAEFCKHYAQIAVQQYRTANENNLPGIVPPAWSDDSRAHEAWCRMESTSQYAADQETTNRQIHLDRYLKSGQTATAANGSGKGAAGAGTFIPIRPLPTTPKALSVIATMQPDSPKSQPKAYKLICRGTLNKAFDIRVDTTQGVQLVYSFRRASKKASEGVNTGECAWLDRPVHSGEPNSLKIPLSQLTNGKPAWEIKNKFGGHTGPAGMAINGYHIDFIVRSENGSSTKHPVSALFDDRAEPLIMDAYNDGDDLVVTHIGP